MSQTTTTTFSAQTSHSVATPAQQTAPATPYLLNEDALKSVGGGISLPVGKW
jgi:hypothetical protein